MLRVGSYSGVGSCSGVDRTQGWAYTLAWAYPEGELILRSRSRGAQEWGHTQWGPHTQE